MPVAVSVMVSVIPWAMTSCPMAVKLVAFQVPTSGDVGQLVAIAVVRERQHHLPGPMSRGRGHDHTVHSRAPREQAIPQHAAHNPG